MTDLPDDFIEQLKAAYPRRPGSGWVAVRRQVIKWVSEGESFADMLAGAKAYADHCRREGTEAKYLKMARTFFGPDQWWLEDYAEPEKPKTAAQVNSDRRWDALISRATSCGFRQPTAIERSVDPSVYEGKLREFEGGNVTQLRRA